MSGKKEIFMYKALYYSLFLFFWVGSASFLTANVIPVDPGTTSYVDSKPAHQKGPSQAPIFNMQTNSLIQDWTPAHPKVSEVFKASGKPITTHEFWSSVLWSFLTPSIDANGNQVDVSYVPYSNVLIAWPWMGMLNSSGAELLYNPTPTLTPLVVDGKPYPSSEYPQWTSYGYDFRRGDADLVISVDGLNSAQTLVDDYGDWHVRVLWSNADNSQNLWMTMGEGFPYTWFETRGSNKITIKLRPGTRIWYESKGTVAISREDTRTHYLLVAPPNAQWSYTLDNEVLRYVSTLNLELPAETPYLTVAVLPDDTNELIYIKTDGVENLRVGTSLQWLPLKKEGTLESQSAVPLFQDFFGNFGGYLESLGGYDERLQAQRPGNFELSPELLTLINYYRAHAFARPEETKINWKYNPRSSSVTNTFQVSSKQLLSGEGFSSTPLLVLWKHQWLNDPNRTYSYTYHGPRGGMILFEGSQFSTRVPFIGVLPSLPDLLGNKEKVRLNTYLDLVTDPTGRQAPRTLVSEGVMDTYQDGKDLGRLAQLVPIAFQAGRPELANQYLEILKAHLNDWLDASDASRDLPVPPGTPATKEAQYKKRYFYYDKEWNTLIGYPASFSSDTELNDHHFHYGYLIMAAAIVARYDKQWAEQHKEMIKLLIKDSANWQREDKRFPFLRNFSPYLGFSIANGHVNFASGVNQESSSEAMNFNAALILWGSEVGDQEIRDLGIFLYANELAAIRLYWYGKYEEVFPTSVWYLQDGKEWVQRSFNREALGIVWGNKGDFATWFAAIPHFIYGINWLPITPASLYLGHIIDISDIHYKLDEQTLQYMNWEKDQAFVRKSRAWSDIVWSTAALFSPIDATERFNENASYLTENAPLTNEDPTAPIMGEKGDSKAHTFHWIFTLNRLGQLNPYVTANVVHYAVFFGPDNRLRYIVYNPGKQPLKAKFSDGTLMEVAPGELQVKVKRAIEE